MGRPRLPEGKRRACVCVYLTDAERDYLHRKYGGVSRGLRRLLDADMGAAPVKPAAPSGPAAKPAPATQARQAAPAGRCSRCARTGYNPHCRACNS